MKRSCDWFVPKMRGLALSYRTKKWWRTKGEPGQKIADLLTRILTEASFPDLKHCRLHYILWIGILYIKIWQMKPNLLIHAWKLCVALSWFVWPTFQAGQCRRPCALRHQHIWPTQWNDNFKTHIIITMASFGSHQVVFGQQWRQCCFDCQRFVPERRFLLLNESIFPKCFWPMSLLIAPRLLSFSTRAKDSRSRAFSSSDLVFSRSARSMASLAAPKPSSRVHVSFERYQS